MFVVVVLLFFVPGLAVCVLLGVRGWRLAAVSPAVTFGLAGVGGPLLAALHVRWSLLSFAVWTLAVAGVLFAAARLWARLRPVRVDGDGDAPATGPRRRARWEHLTVGGAVVLGMAVGALADLRATHWLRLTAQDWDAPFHANAVRWIAEHGSALPGAIAPTANLAPGTPYYYPITYHSLLALVTQTFGTSPSWLLNAGALTMVLIWPLGIAALGLAWRVPAPVVAVAAAVSTWFTAFPYDSLFRGPLWPYVAGLALVPGLLGALRMVVERAPLVTTAATVAFAVTGVVCMHPSIAFVLLVYVAALLGAFLFRLEPVRWRAVLPRLVATGALTVVILLPVVLPARVAGAGVQAARWPLFADEPEAFGQAVLFSPVNTLPQWWLGLAALVGLALMVLRRRLVWVVAAYLVFGAAYAVTASMANGVVFTLAGPFYDDAWRFAALLPLAGAFAVGETLVALGSWLAPRVRLGGAWPGVVAATAAALVVLALLGNGAYVGRNTARLALGYGNGPTVSSAEVAAYDWLGRHVRPGQRVMNDYLDGSVWMYADAGVQPMEWTFYGAAEGSAAQRLYQDLNRMDTDAQVRRLVEQANVAYVIVGKGFVRVDSRRAPGLTHLDEVRGLRQVFGNEGATIYEVETSAIG